MPVYPYIVLWNTATPDKIPPACQNKTQLASHNFITPHATSYANYNYNYTTSSSELELLSPLVTDSLWAHEE